MYTLKFKTAFSAAHQLTNAYDKSCNESIHGHTWRVSVEISTEKLSDNMVIDFTKIKELIDRLDHKNLNEVLDFEPTAELVAKYLHSELKKSLPDEKGSSVKVTVWESDDASITYSE